MKSPLRYEKDGQKEGRGKNDRPGCEEERAKGKGERGGNRAGVNRYDNEKRGRKGQELASMEEREGQEENGSKRGDLVPHGLDEVLRCGGVASLRDIRRARQPPVSLVERKERRRRAKNR